MRRHIKKTVAVVFCILLSLPTIQLRAQNQPEVAPSKKSDSFATTESGHKIRVQHGELAKGNFQILGVDLAADEEVLAQAARLLGNVPTVSKGDAADAIEQACYRSVGENADTFLVFGRGEVDYSFVLSSDSPAWKRNHACRESSEVNRRIATSSGLHLGQTQKQVIDILGLPTARRYDAVDRRDFLEYDFERQKRTAPQSLARARQQYPEMSKREFHQNYDFYDLGETIDLRFVNDRLSEMRVDWVATY
ncbi:MAG TPA: hypothetical protein VFW25_08450 [Silvibacterium sp.]|nr:hypothetical protein [Silvibacterium sp.]